MPVLKNAKHERFAQLVAQGEALVDAHEMAGYKRNDGNASTLAANPEIAVRLKEIKAGAAERAELTVEGLIDELEVARRAAEKQPNGAAAMVSATMAKAKLAGLIVEKREDVTPRRTTEQIDARIVELLGAGSKERIARIVGRTSSDGQSDQTVPTVPGHGTA